MAKAEETMLTMTWKKIYHCIGQLRDLKAGWLFSLICIVHSEMESPRKLPLRTAFKTPSDICAVIASMQHHLKNYSYEYYIFLFVNKNEQAVESRSIL